MTECPFVFSLWHLCRTLLMKPLEHPPFHDSGYGPAFRALVLPSQVLFLVFLTGSSSSSTPKGFPFHYSGASGLNRSPGLLDLNLWVTARRLHGHICHTSVLLIPAACPKLLLEPQCHTPPPAGCSSLLPHQELTPLARPEPKCLFFELPLRRPAGQTPYHSCNLQSQYLLHFL